MEKSPKKAPLWERAAGFLERLHYAIGATALGGFAAETLTGAALIRPELLLAVGVIEVGHGLIIKGLKSFIKNRGKKNKSSPAAAFA